MRLVVVLALCLFVTGCHQMLFSSSIPVRNVTVVIGETTEAQVQAALGPPLRRSEYISTYGPQVQYDYNTRGASFNINLTVCDDGQCITNHIGMGASALKSVCSITFLNGVAHYAF